MTEINTGLHYPVQVNTLPRSWLCDFIGTFTASVQSGFACGAHNSQAEGVAHIRPMNISRSGRIQLRELRFVSPDHDDRRLAEGDVLFNNTNSPELIGKTAYVTCDAAGLAFSNHMTRLRLLPVLDAKFAASQLHYLWSMKYFLHRCVKHVNQASVSATDLAKSVPLVVPPLNEQRRIVAKIEELFSELDKGVESLTTARAQLKAYRQSVLKHAFEGKLTEDWRAQNPDKLESPEALLARIKKEREDRYKAALNQWEIDVAERRSNGEKGKKPAKPKRPRSISKLALENSSNGFWPILELGDLISVGSGCGLTSQQMQGGLHAVYGGNGINGYHDDYFVENAELIIGRVGAKCGVTHITLPKSWVTDNALIVSPLISSFDKNFFKWLLSLKNLNSLGSSTGQPVISGSKIYPVTINMPSIDEQAEIVRLLENKLQAADIMEAEIDAALARADALRQAILKKAFSGQLVAQNPSDEPASVMLERIRAEQEREQPKKRRAKKNNNKKEVA